MKSALQVNICRKRKLHVSKRQFNCKKYRVDHHTLLKWDGLNNYLYMHRPQVVLDS